MKLQTIILMFVGAWVVSGIESLAQAQDQRTDATKKMLIKMAIERAKLIQFECEVQVSTNLPTKRQEFILPQKVTEATFELYFSAIGEYWIQISKYTNPYSNESEVFYRGILENAKVLGFIQHSKMDSIAIITSDLPPEFRVKKLYDFRAIGLGFPSDHFACRRFEGLEATLLDVCEEHSEQDNGIIRFKWNERNVIDIDSTRGYWPIYAKTENSDTEGDDQASSEWRIELIEVNEVWVPKSAHFEAKDCKLDFAFHWKSVNEPMWNSRQRVEAIAARDRLRLDYRPLE